MPLNIQNCWVISSPSQTSQLKQPFQEEPKLCKPFSTNPWKRLTSFNPSHLRLQRFPEDLQAKVFAARGREPNQAKAIAFEGLRPMPLGPAIKLQWFVPAEIAW